jgi:hypothetical protein
MVDVAMNVDYVHEQEEKSYVYFILGKFRRKHAIRSRKIT